MLLFVLAPVFAEFSSGYLPSTGDPAALAVDLLFFIPLYGFVVVLIREVAVARGLGWPGVLLLAAAFGTLQAGLVDRSIFTLSGTGIEYWADIMNPTWVPTLGLSAGATVGWVLGHVVASVGAPIAITSLLVPGSRRRRLLGPVGLVLLTAGWLLFSVAVHTEIGKTYRPVPSVGQYALVVGLAAVLVLLALSPAGRPLRRRRAQTDSHPTTFPGSTLVGVGVPLAVGAVVTLCLDQAALSWVFTAVCVLVVAAALGWAARWRRSRWWSPVTPAALAVGAMGMRALGAFQTPAMPGVDETAKLVQHLVFLALVLGLGVLVVAGQRSHSRRLQPA